MSGLLTVPGLVPPPSCSAYGRHRPTPLRFVWHHILPQEAGGLTEPSNLVALCDGCHYSVHALMFYAVTHDGLLPKGVGTREQRLLAMQGVALAQAAGTLDKIPDEGGRIG